MEIGEIIKRLQDSKEFTDWKKDNKGHLAHALLMLDESNAWQIGYYNPDSDTMTTFIVSDNLIETISNQEILRSEQEIKELQLDDVKIGHEEVLKKAMEYHHLHHPREVILKKFFVIQQFHDETIYNMTFFFQSLKTLNIKISAKTGEIVSHSYQSLIDLDKK